MAVVRKDSKTTGDAATMESKLLRVAHMFEEHRDDLNMRELCRLAIKVAQEGLIRA